MTPIAIDLKSGKLQSSPPPVVGIDLGTTNSLIAIIDNKTQKPIVLQKENANKLIPSIVHFDEGGKVVVGDEAKRMHISFPERTINSVKRLMGKSYTEINKDEFAYKVVDYGKDQLVRIKVGNQYFTPIELSAFILKDLKKTAEAILTETISQAVITVPAYFNDTQRQAVKDAGKLAGLEVLRIINEPTAAGLAYGIGTMQDDSRVIAVYDLGGGTFDVSILRITGSIFEVIATKGDTHLGGDDIDNMIASYWQEHYSLPTSMVELKSIAEKAKKILSTQEMFEDETVINGVKLYLDKSQLMKITKDFVSRTITICNDAMKDASLSKGSIDNVIMIGGATRSPFIRQAVAAFFEREVDCSVNPDEAVAIGAAVQANILIGQHKDILLLDVNPLSLGVETMGGLMDVLIPRNTTIPTKANRSYTTQKNGQANMRISIFQGERDLVADNRKLAEFTLKGIPPMPAGLAKVHISFFIDADGILTVQAKEEKSGVAQQVAIKPQSGLTEDEIAKLLRQSLEYVKEDSAKKGLIEARVEATQLITVAKQFINKNKSLLTEQEFIDTTEAIENYESQIHTQEDKDKIYAWIDTFNSLTTPFAERIMSVSIQSSLKGKSIE